VTRTPNSTDRAGTRRPRGHAVRTALAAAAWLACFAQAHALGLGRLNVQSALGEPLVAEIDVTSLTQEQAASLRVGVASSEVYRAAGMEFTDVLRGVQVTLARRPDGRAVLRITSDRAARDPFVDLILQATWASGRLVREYTVLLDPPRSGPASTDVAAVPPIPGDPPPAAAAGWGTRLPGATPPSPLIAAAPAGAGRPADRPATRPAPAAPVVPAAAVAPAAPRAAAPVAPAPATVASPAQATVAPAAQAVALAPTPAAAAASAPAGPTPAAQAAAMAAAAVVPSLPGPGAAPAPTASTGAAPAAAVVTTSPSAAPAGAVSSTGAGLSGPSTSTAMPPAGPALSSAGSGSAAGETQVVSTRPEAAPSPGAREVKTAARPAGAQARAGRAATTGAGAPGPREVRPGDTLYGIARSVLPESVSLDQMLVALYRDNPQAFAGGNMNRLLAGSALEVPAAEAAGAIPVAEARQLIEAQSADLSAYRQRLAARPATTPGEEPQRAASGTVQTRVQDRAQAKAAEPDQLKLSRGNVKPGATPEAALAATAEAKDLAQRESELARNVEALRRLEAGSAAGGAGASKTGKSVPADAAAASADVRAPTASVAASSAVPVAVTAALTPPTQAAAPAASGGAAAASAAAPAASAAPAPDVAGSAAEPAVAASQPALAARVQQAVLSSPYALPAAGGLVLLLAALGSFSLLRRRRKSAPAATSADEDVLDPALEPGVPAATAGRPARPEFASAMAAATLAETAPVLDDPVADPAPRATDHLADAEVYLAYGRHDEAVAVLRAGLQAEPRRSDIAFKLLELHAARQEHDNFEAVADVMYERTGGQGSEWARVVALQRTLAPREEELPAEFAPQPPAQSPAPAPLQAAVPVAATDRREPTLGPEPAEVSASDFALDMDVSAIDAQARARERGGVDLGLDETTPLPAAAPGASGEALDRKLALAEEFIQIGDVEGARDLLGEVGAQGDGPLKERAQRLLDALG
jgi:pilus assembly protein FimV